MHRNPNDISRRNAVADCGLINIRHPPDICVAGNSGRYKSSSSVEVLCSCFFGTISCSGLEDTYALLKAGLHEHVKTQALEHLNL